MEAPSREHVLAILKSEGIRPIRIKAVSGKKISSNPRRRNLSTGKCVAAFGLVITATVAVTLFLSDEATSPNLTTTDVPRKRTGLAAEVKPSAAPAPVQDPIKEVAVKTNAPLAYLKDLSPEERRAEIQRLNEEKPIDLTQPTNRIFATGTEQVMAWIFTTNLGDMPPLLPNLPNFELAHLQEILEHRNIVFESDDEKTEDAKRTVDAAKEYLKEYIDKGGDPQKFLQFYRDELQQAFETRLAAQKQVMQVIREEPEIAAEFINEVNAELDKKNIKHVRIPPPLRKRLGLE
jgi:hypothetical protein